MSSCIRSCSKLLVRGSIHQIPRGDCILCRTSLRRSIHHQGWDVHIKSPIMGFSRPSKVLEQQYGTTSRFLLYLDVYTEHSILHSRRAQIGHNEWMLTCLLAAYIPVCSNGPIGYTTNVVLHTFEIYYQPSEVRRQRGRAGDFHCRF